MVALDELLLLASVVERGRSSGVRLERRKVEPNEHRRFAEVAPLEPLGSTLERAFFHHQVVEGELHVSCKIHVRRLVLPPLPIENNDPALSVAEHAVVVSNNKIEMRSEVDSVEGVSGWDFRSNQCASLESLGESLDVNMNDACHLGKNVLAVVFDRLAKHSVFFGKRLLYIRRSDDDCFGRVALETLLVQQFASTTSNKTTIKSSGRNAFNFRVQPVPNFPKAIRRQFAAVYFR